MDSVETNRTLTDAEFNDMIICMSKAGPSSGIEFSEIRNVTINGKRAVRMLQKIASAFNTIQYIIPYSKHMAIATLSLAEYCEPLEENITKSLATMKEIG